ncbi:MAG: branched-chain amino acid transport system substrate-binding protein [Planctomycetota bacterium]|jgi:branched-chain amino acid transport system substrate-binding protein
MNQRQSVCWSSTCAFFACVAAIFLTNACSGESDTESTPGVSKSEILIGSSCPLTGHAEFLGTQYTRGSLALFKKVNREGGVHGREIRLISLDDGYDPPRTVVNTKKLIEVDKVFMLMNYVGTPTSVKVIAIVHEATIPAFGFLTGAEKLRTPLKPFMFHVRSSYYAETEAAVSYFVDHVGLDKIAVMYQDDAFGQAVLRGVQLALSRRGKEIVSTGTYTRGTMDVERALDAIAPSSPQAVIMVGTSAALARFSKLSHERGFKPYFHTVSFVGSEAFARELIDVQKIEKAEYEKLIVTQVVPSPYSVELTAVAEYRKLAELYYPDDSPNYVALEGYINAKVLVDALRKAGPNLTRSQLLQTLEDASGFDPGIGANVGYSSRDHKGLKRVFLSRLSKDGQFRTFEL